MKSIVITGVSSGIGYATSTEFIRNGYRVFGSVRKQEQAEMLKEELGPNFEPLLFDLTNHDAIQQEAERVESLLGGTQLRGLINNAGETQGGPLMHIPIENVRKNFEVLVIGQLAVTQAFLPLLGASNGRQVTPGKILMISSTSGKIAFPFAGPYASSKHAIEALSKSLRTELMLYGIDVIVIGPGNIKTKIWDKNGMETVSQYEQTDYHEPLLKMHEYLQNRIPKESLELEDFSKKLLQIFETPNPKARYTIVKNPIKNWIITHLIPQRLLDKLTAKKFGLTQ